MTTAGQEREQVAYHEAGHAVIAHSFRHNITKLDLDGCTVEIAPTRQAAEETIVVSLSGGIAARRFSGNGADDGGLGDDKYVRYLALRLSEGRESEATALVDWLRCRATTAVDRHWPQIEEVAGVLLDKKELSGAEIKEVLR